MGLIFFVCIWFRHSTWGAITFRGTLVQLFWGIHGALLVLAQLFWRTLGTYCLVHSCNTRHYGGSLVQLF